MSSHSKPPSHADDPTLSGSVSAFLIAGAAAPWLKVAARAAGGLSFALGLAVMIGWHAGVQSLVQVAPNLVPMQYNTALGFLLGGAALFFATGRRARGAIVLGAIPAAVALLTLGEDLASVDLGIDRLLMDPWVTVKTVHPGRMAPATAVCFVAAGAAVAAICRRESGVGGILGSVVAALGSGTLVEYLIGEETPYGWQGPTPMALHTVAGFTVLGLGIVALAWQKTRGRVEGAPRWAAVAVAAYLAIVTLGLGQAVKRAELRQLDRLVERNATIAGDRIEARLNQQILELLRMASRLAPQSATTLTGEKEVSFYLEHEVGWQAIEWVDASWLVRWSAPAGRVTTVLDADGERKRRAAFDAARAHRRPMITAPIELAQGGRIVMAGVPVFVDDRFTGFVQATMEPDRLLETILDGHRSLGYAIAVLDGGEEVAGDPPTPPGEAEERERYAREAAIEAGGRTWRARIWPSPELVSLQQTTALPAIVMLAGLPVALLMGLLIDRARAARNRELEFRALFESSPSATIAVDRRGTVRLVNARAEEILGYRRDELMGKSVDILVPDRFQSIHAHLRGSYLRAPQPRGIGNPRLVHAKTRDGRELPVDIRLSPVWRDAGLLVVAAITDVSEYKRMEEKLRAWNLHLEQEVAQRTTALEERAGELERTNAELRRSNADLQQFAYVASHDLQEPLRQIASFTQLLARRYRDRLDGDADEFIGYVLGGAQRMQRLIQALLSFSRLGTHGGDFAATDCNDLLDSVLSDLKMSIDESSAVITREALPAVHADPLQLRLVFQNLISNAIKFRDQTRRPEVHVGAQNRDGEWIFSVHDNGIGIAPEHIERIFVIFQRLHSVSEYPGTGIGLAICKRVIERHRGRIWVDSKTGHGSTFYFTLPGGSLPEATDGASHERIHS